MFRDHFCVLQEAPTSQTRQIADGKSGQWKLEQVLYPELLEVPLKIRCLLTVREEKEIGLVLKVAQKERETKQEIESIDSGCLTSLDSCLTPWLRLVIPTL